MTYIPGAELGRGASVTFTPNATPTITTPTASGFLSLVSVTPPGTSVGEVENVLLSSTFKGYLPTLPEGEGSLKIQHWDGDPSCVAMQGYCQKAPVPQGVFAISLATGGTITFPGFPKKYAIDEIANEEILMADIDYRQTGPATFTNGTVEPT